MRNFNIFRIFEYVSTLVGIFKHAKSPLIILFCYLIRRTPKRIKTRSGLTIIPSSNPHDIVTFVVVFCKRDYGLISAGSVVIDVGANIGMFSLYALSQGASFVECFEPCRESFEVLQKNIGINGYVDAVKLHNKAVSSRSGDVVAIPSVSSPYNIVSEDVRSEDGCFDLVDTINLESALDTYTQIDLMKVDCEGAEFEFFPSLSPSFLDRVSEIRMELHGSLEQLRGCFNYFPFEIVVKGGQDVWLVKLS